MIRFECDYAEGAHERILKKLLETNREQTIGYGEDEYCKAAANLIRKECKSEKAEVHFLVGGTQTNTTVISALLKPYQGVIAAETGHIAVHETGAIEATGHKVLTLSSADGKIKAEQIEAYYQDHFMDNSHEHMVQPGMVYISNPTENGTIYSKHELMELSSVCRKRNLPLFLDGARLGYGLMVPGYDITLADIAALTDVFYIGGTKVGALFGEAVVIPDPTRIPDFRYSIKQKGGMLAKGRLLGIQFQVLFEDGLYYSIAKEAVEQALLIRQAFEQKGIPLLYDSFTNQQFPILKNTVLDSLKDKYAFSVWQKISETETAVRFCTSWATTSEMTRELLEDIRLL